MLWTFTNFLEVLLSCLRKAHFSRTRSVLSFWLVLQQLEGMNSGRNQDGHDDDDAFGDDDDGYDAHADDYDDDDANDAEVNDDDEIDVQAETA